MVYKITIADTVEERILELQEKKRELANQAIEGGAKGGAGKLGMKEILQLFRRDAEHEPSRAGPRMYESPGKPAVLRMSGRESESAYERNNERKKTPPFVPKGPRIEHPVYGRR